MSSCGVLKRSFHAQNKRSGEVVYQNIVHPPKRECWAQNKESAKVAFFPHGTLTSDVTNIDDVFPPARLVGKEIRKFHDCLGGESTTEND